MAAGKEEQLAAVGEKQETRKRHDRKHNDDDDDDKSNNGGDNKRRKKISDHDLAALDHAYQVALQEYKADKSNKELRRAKTAAKKAWDEALIASAAPGAKPLTCRNCSQLFLFTASKEFEEKGWEDPVQCKACTKQIGIRRAKDRRTVDKRQNMCYEFQKTGTCSRGDRCKFSHAEHHVGKAKKAGRLTTTTTVCKYFDKGETCPHGDKCRFRHESGGTDTPQQQEAGADA
jgi:hypothetical protein